MANIIRLGGGGGMKATLIWTNPNPTLNTFGSASENTILNGLKNILSYDYLFVTWKQSQADIITRELMINISQIDDSLVHYGFASLTNAVGSTWRTRIIRIESDTSISIWTNRAINGTGITNYYGIPLQIYGVKGEIKGV